MFEKIFKKEMLMEKSELVKGLILKSPRIHRTAFTATGSRIIGDVILKEDSSVWYNTVARADINRITIGKRSNIQDNSVIHLENDQGVDVGDDVTVGHNAIIHGCTYWNGCNYYEWCCYRKRCCHWSWCGY